MAKLQPPIGTRDEWEVICPPDKFDTLRDDPAFAQLLALARLLNALRYVQCTWSCVPRQKIRATRHRINSFLTMGALLFEGTKLVKRMGQHFRNLSSWESFVTVQRDKRFIALLDNLGETRNQVVFHVFENVFKEQIRQWQHDGEDVVFVRGRGRGVADTYHDLADSMATQIFVGPTESETDFQVLFPILSKTALEMTIAFLNAADRVIFEALLARGFEIRRRHRGRNGSAVR